MKYLILGVSFIALPFVALYMLCFDRPRLREYMDSFQQSWLSDGQNRHRIQFDIVQTTPMLDPAHTVQQDVDAFIDAQDYLRLADFMMDLDQKRAKCPSQKSLALAALIHFADRTHIPNNVGVETDDSFAAQIEHLSLVHPHRYTLIAMTTLLRIREAWAARGDGFADSISAKRLGNY